MKRLVLKQSGFEEGDLCPMDFTSVESLLSETGEKRWNTPNKLLRNKATSTVP